MPPKLLRRLATSFGASLLLLAAGEILLRTQVAESGTTPFRTSEVPGLACEFRPSFTTLYKGFEIDFNSAGFRGPEFPARREGVMRVALVGDSFTFGTGVDLPDTLAVKLEEALAAAGRPAQVFNLGVPGYTSTNIASVVENKALPLDLDAIVYVFFGNDVDEPRARTTIPTDASIDTYYEYPLRSALLQWSIVRMKQLALSMGIALGRRTAEWSRHEYEGAGGERVRAAFQRMQSLCNAKHVALLVASYPFLTRVDLNPFRPIDTLALADAKALGLPAVDLVDAFPGENDLSGYWVSAFDQHPCGRANAKVAALLAKELVELPR